MFTRMQTQQFRDTMAHSCCSLKKQKLKSTPSGYYRILEDNIKSTKQHRTQESLYI